MNTELIYVQLPTGYEMPALTVPDISRLVCEHFNLSEDLVRSKSRKRELVDARHIISYLSLVNVPRVLLRHIGDYLGTRDHTSIIHSRGAVGDWIDTRDPIVKEVDNLQRQIDKLRQGVRKAA